MGRLPMRGKEVGREVPVVPFGETVLYRKPEVAIDMHQALEERWGKCVWLGNTRNTLEEVVSIDEGFFKAWAVRRPPRGGAMGFGQNSTHARVPQIVGQRHGQIFP